MRRGAVSARIQEFLDDLELRYPNQDVEDINSKIARHRLLSWLEERLADLCEALQGVSGHPTLGNLRSSLVEGVDSVFLVMLHALETGDRDAHLYVTQLTDDRNEVMVKIRNAYVDATPALETATRASIYKLIGMTEQTFYLLSKLARELHDTAGPPGEIAPGYVPPPQP